MILISERNGSAMVDEAVEVGDGVRAYGILSTGVKEVKRGWGALL
jgi:hypothetical protein